MFEQYSYLITILFFAGGSILIEWLIGYKYLKKHLREILIAGIVGVLFTAPLEGTALVGKDYSFYPETTLNTLLFGAELETYLFSFLVGIAVASATFIGIRIEDMRKNKSDCRNHT